MNIRPAVATDRAELARLLIEFDAESPHRTLVPVTPADLLEGVDYLLGTATILVAECADGTLAGLLAGIIAPQWYAPSKIIGHELAWFVSPAHRGGRAGIALLYAWKDWLRDAKVDGATFASILKGDLEGLDPTRRVLEALGWKAIETGYMRGPI